MERAGLVLACGRFSPGGGRKLRRMTEKRQRQQQRRARRQAVGRTRGSSGSGRVRAGTPGVVDFELAGMLAELAEIVVGDAHEPNDALEAEHWASCLLGALKVGRIIDAEIRERFRADLVPAVEKLGSAEALGNVAWALSGVKQRARAGACTGGRGPPCGYGGAGEPAWASGIGLVARSRRRCSTTRGSMNRVSAIVEFDGYGEESHTLGIYIDHNMGGLVKDVFLAGPLIDVRAKLSVRAPNGVELAVRDLELAEARARTIGGLRRSRPHLRASCRRGRFTGRRGCWSRRGSICCPPDSSTTTRITTSRRPIANGC